MSEINRVLVDRAQDFTEAEIWFGLTDAYGLQGNNNNNNNMMPYLALTYLIYSPETVYEPGMVYYNGSYITGPNGGYFTGKGV